METITKKSLPKFSPEVRERAVRMVLEHEGEYASRWEAVRSIAPKFGCSAHALLEWVKKVEVDGGRRIGIPSDVTEKLKAQEREIRELRQATRSCAKHPLILLRRSSTTGTSHDRLH